MSNPLLEKTQIIANIATTVVGLGTLITIIGFILKRPLYKQERLAKRIKEFKEVRAALSKDRNKFYIRTLELYGIKYGKLIRDKNLIKNEAWLRAKLKGKQERFYYLDEINVCWHEPNNDHVVEADNIINTDIALRSFPFPRKGYFYNLNQVRLTEG